jgi:hypothetical protein
MANVAPRQHSSAEPASRAGVTSTLPPRAFSDRPREAPAHPVAGILWIVFAIILATGVAGGIVRGLRNRPDWDNLHLETTYVWEHGQTCPGTGMFGYLPATTFALWPFMVWPPQPWGLIAYVCANVLAAVGSLWIVYRWWLRGRARVPAGSFVIPALLISANLQHVIQANQLTLWTLFLCVAGLALVANRHRFAGGAVLALAGLIKSMPFLLIGYLLLRREWRALVGALAAVVAFDVVPSIAFFGWHGAIAEHRAWLHRADWHSSTVQIENPLLIGLPRHRSNFSYASVLTHWLRAMPDVHELVVLSGDPPADLVEQTRASLGPGDCLVMTPRPPRDKPWGIERVPREDAPRFCLANLSAQTVWWIWASTLAFAMAALVYATWRTGRHSGGVDWAPAAAMWMLAMFWLSPMTRHYYLALAFPALAVVWQATTDGFRRCGRRWDADTRLGVIAMLAWLVGVACLGWDAGRWYGIHLAVLAILAAATTRAWRQTLKSASP